MLGILFIILFATYLIFLHPLFSERKEPEHTDKFNSQMKKLWTVAQTSMKERKPLRAEKALLTILKFDETNAAAYNRLGILYAKSQKYDEAIECFEIAQSLDNNASSLHNVGLIYLETGDFEKAAMAFEQALKLEEGIASRYLALAKAKEKLGQNKAAIEALEEAYKLDQATSTLRQILAIYEALEDAEAITATTARIETQIAEDAKKREEAARERSHARRTNTSARTGIANHNVRVRSVPRSTASSSHATTAQSPRASRLANRPAKTSGSRLTRANSASGSATSSRLAVRPRAAKAPKTPKPAKSANKPPRRRKVI